VVFEFLRRRKKPSPPPEGDPLAAFDGMLASLDRQSAQLRRSAATLLTLRAGLARDRLRYQEQLTELPRRLAVAAAQGDALAERTLSRDEDQVRARLVATEEALAHAEGNARLLLAAAEELADQRAALETERVSARVRLSTGVVVSEALRQRAAEFDRLMKLDAARDEVERAQALAELYREDLEVASQPPR
jgi:hypothetical protein